MLPVGPTDGPGGTSPAWADIRQLATAADRSGLDSVWLADHHGMHESWTLLSAVAAVTSRVELGPLVLCASFRDPGLLANMAATLDRVAAGRLILGVGAGWNDPEYHMFGLPTDHRFSRFAEWLEILARLLRGETVSFDGTYHRVRDAVLVPPPGRRIPLLVAGGRPRMRRLTAHWADAWNTAWYGRPDESVKDSLRTFDATLAAEGRAPESVSRTVGVTVVDPDQSPTARPRAGTFAGPVPELAAALAGYADLGVDHVIVGLDPLTSRSVDRLAQAVALAA